MCNFIFVSSISTTLLKHLTIKVIYLFIYYILTVGTTDRTSKKYQLIRKKQFWAQLCYWTEYGVWVIKILYGDCLWTKWTKKKISQGDLKKKHLCVTTVMHFHMPCFLQWFTSEVPPVPVSLCNLGWPRLWRNDKLRYNIDLILLWLQWRISHIKIIGFRLVSVLCWNNSGQYKYKSYKL